jgi:N-sulfoglucosamine sulfohydrolase
MSLTRREFLGVAAADPDEVVNVASALANTNLLADFRAQLAGWRTATRDPWMQGVTDPFGHAH